MALFLFSFTITFASSISNFRLLYTKYGSVIIASSTSLGNSTVIVGFLNKLSFEVFVFNIVVRITSFTALFAHVLLSNFVSIFEIASFI